VVISETRQQNLLLNIGEAIKDSLKGRCAPSGYAKQTWLIILQPLSWTSKCSLYKAHRELVASCNFTRGDANCHHSGTGFSKLGMICVAHYCRSWLTACSLRFRRQRFSVLRVSHCNRNKKCCRRCSELCIWSPSGSE
jgi:hypothetical protein